MLIRFVFLFLLLNNRLVAQQQFSPEQLLEPKKYGPQISALLGTQEIPAFKDTAANTLFLRNGFRSSTFVNEDDWLAIQETLYLVSIPGMKEKLLKGTATPNEECATEIPEWLLGK